MKNKQITLRFTAEQHGEIIDKAQAVSRNAYGLAKAAILSFTPNPKEAKALLRRVESMTVADILEAVVISATIIAPTSTEELEVYRAILKLEQQLLVKLTAIENKGKMQLTDTHEIRSIVADIKTAYILTIKR